MTRCLVEMPWEQNLCPVKAPKSAPAFKLNWTVPDHVYLARYNARQARLREAARERLRAKFGDSGMTVSYTHLRAHETEADL
eukprot:2168236-Amphidinium_carterae.1